MSTQIPPNPRNKENNANFCEMGNACKPRQPLVISSRPQKICCRNGENAQRNQRCAKHSKTRKRMTHPQTDAMDQMACFKADAIDRLGFFGVSAIPVKLPGVSLAVNRADAIWMIQLSQQSSELPNSCIPMPKMNAGPAFTQKESIRFPSEAESWPA